MNYINVKTESIDHHSNLVIDARDGISGQSGHVTRYEDNFVHQYVVYRNNQDIHSFFNEMDSLISEYAMSNKHVDILVNADDYVEISKRYKEFTPLYPRMIATVDVVALSIINNRIHVCLINREKHPYKDMLALPGRFIHFDENEYSDSSAEGLCSSMGLKARLIEQVRTVAEGGRDIRGPGGWAMSVIYLALVSSDDTAGFNFVDINELNKLSLAFDHHRLIDIAVQHFKNKARYSAYPMLAMPLSLHMPDIINAYGMITGLHIDQSSFRRKLNALDILISEKSVGRGSPRIHTLKHDIDPVFERAII